ncbi:NAD(P)-binding protein [Crepidotus variabilis]|uniref:NAD(P)-binding protein n=1 Tax=Crepidotus variabilis TaxID=179855 RepID=A0A9P6JV82_9AGAR|nr:NAD(P)-binding protein [Crepidotus variabilis]
MVAEQRVWFITGASGGLGKSLVEAVLESGENVVATARRISTLDYLKIQYGPTRILVVALDVAVNEQIDEAFKAMIDHFGRLDVVVNNAGSAIFGEIEGIPEDAARKLFDLLFWGPVYISKLAAKTVREVNKPGHGAVIFNISSAGGYNASPGLAFYAAGKFALEGFSEAFSKELLPEWNIKICIIEPGGFETGWRGSTTVYDEHPAYVNNPANFRGLRNSIPYLGDPLKGAKALIRLSHEPKLPMRIALGSDSHAIVKTKAKLVAQDAEEWSFISRSTDRDDLDGVAYGEMIIKKLKETSNN